MSASSIAPYSLAVHIFLTISLLGTAPCGLPSTPTPKAAPRKALYLGLPSVMLTVRRYSG